MRGWVIGMTVLMGGLLSACAPNTAWRTRGTVDCSSEPKSCERTTASTENYDNFKVSFVEFSERGNMFDRNIYQDVLDEIKSEASKDGVLVVVFVHGWKHNASPSDPNVVDFRNTMKLLARSKLRGTRSVHGVYVGWRGLSLHGLGSENLTYWGRKYAAEEIGRGGVTDLLLGLEAITGKIHDLDNKNLLVVVGHSFGGAVVLSSLNDVLLDRMNAYLGNIKGPYPAFGSGVILLNPAIEADQIFQLKELSHRIGEDRVNRAKPLHVVSSKGDTATTTPFFFGQALGTGLGSNQQTIERDFDNKHYRFSEFSLDTVTVGNYLRFRTDNLTRDNELDRWTVSSTCTGNVAGVHDPDTAPIPCNANDPIAFVYTSPDFIHDHNDVFNLEVIAYVASTISESLKDALVTDGGTHQVRNRRLPKECLDKADQFSFDLCFSYNRSLFNDYKNSMQ